jgi:hypothetical protein
VDKIRVLSEAVNYAVLQLPGRRYPGLLVQGDRLREWTRLAMAGDPESIAILADALSVSLEEYDRVCRDQPSDE